MGVTTSKVNNYQRRLIVQRSAPGISPRSNLQLAFFCLPYCHVTAEMFSALSLSGVAVSAGRSVYTVVSAEASSAGLTSEERPAVCRDQSGAKAEPRAG